MAKVMFTDVYLRALQAPPSGRLEVMDARCVGLAIRVTPAGVKSWSFRYRDKIKGSVERLSLGRFPEVGLAKARELASAHRGAVVVGESPREKIRQAKVAERAAILMNDLIDQYIERRVRKATPKSVASVGYYFKPVRDAWGKRKAKDITRADVIAFLNKRGEKAPIGANRTRSVLGTMFGWAIDNDILETSPMVRIPKPGIERAGDRVIQPAEFKMLWTAFDGLESAAMAAAFRVVALTGQRPGEVIGMTRSELFDLDKPELSRWEIPGDRTKNGRHHIVPLVGMARDIVIAAIKAKHEKDESDWVFTSNRVIGERFDSHSFARAMKRIVVGLKAAPDTKATVASLQAGEPTPRDFRRTLVTGLGRLGMRREDTKSVVNHSEGDVTDQHYDRYDRLPEKRRALTSWDAEVASWLGLAPRPDNVIRMRDAV